MEDIEVNVEIIEGRPFDDKENKLGGSDDSTTPKGSEKTPKKPPTERLVRLPLARVKGMMKKDPDCQMISQDAVFLVTKATELFIEYLSKESTKHAVSSKKKTVSKRHVETAIETVPHLCFLDGALE